MPRRKENLHIARRDTWVPPYGWIRRPPVGDGVPQWSAAEQMPLGYDVPFRTVLVPLCRGGRLCPPCMTAAPCRAGPVCPAGSNAYAAAGHMGPALQGRCVDAVPYTFNPSGHKSPVKITTIPHQILCTYPKCENFAGNGCERSSKVLYLTHTS